MRIVVSTIPPPGWDAYVASRPESPVYLEGRWCQFAARVFSNEPKFITAYDAADRIIGILPLVHLRSVLFSSYMVSLPLFNYGGTLADDDRIAAALMQAAASYAASNGARHIEFRDRVPRDGTWHRRLDKVTMLLPLPRTEQDLLAALGSKLRSQIRRAEREEVQVRTGGAELLDDFYAVFAEGMRDLGTPVYPKRFFRELLSVAGDRCRLVTLQVQGRRAAAGWLVISNGTAEVPWASCRAFAKPLAANMRLYWELLRVAIGAGCNTFDFGRSTRDAGTFRFKKQWGAEPVQLHWHYWAREEGALPDLTPGNARFRLAINLWKRLPVWVTRLIGPLVVRGLP